MVYVHFFVSFGFFILCIYRVVIIRLSFLLFFGLCLYFRVLMAAAQRREQGNEGQ